MNRHPVALRLTAFLPCILAAAAMAGCLLSVAHALPQPAIIPQPASIEVQDGDLTLQGTVVYQCPAEFSAALKFGLARLTTHSPIILKQGDNPKIVVSRDDSMKTGEAYTLRITGNDIRIRAKAPAGVFYATQSLIQLLPPDVFDDQENLTSVTLPLVSIHDAPRYPWRGLMLDSSRHFQTVDEVKRFIDLMSIHKLNVFHWHLTDGHGWRFESKKYPELTNKGAWRMQPGYPEPGKTERYGGFYTQDQIKDVIAFAAQRHITIVPEIDMPGHCFTMISAYPELGCLGEPQEVSYLYTYPADAQRFPDIKGTDVLCVGKDETIKVCMDILDEVMDLFPSEFIHSGGDEMNKAHWKSCQLCQDRRKKLELKDEHELQSWFVRQLDKHITSRGRRLIGWDEILEGGLAENATVMSWQGEQGGIKAAKMGHDVVMSPQTYIYLDHGQSHSPLEPAHWPGHNPLDHVYSYNPTSASLTEQEARHILGVQGNVWTAFIHEQWLLDLQTWPRAAAIAEIGWTPQNRRNWNDFYQRLNITHRKRLDYLGANYWWESSAQLGSWTPEQINGDGKPVNLDFDITDHLAQFDHKQLAISLNYSKGAHGLKIQAVSILAN